MLRDQTKEMGEMRNSVLGPVVEIDGKLWRRDLVAGTWLPFSISGGADDDGDDGDDGDDDDDVDDDASTGDGAGGERTFNQKSVKRIAAKNKREGKRAGQRELLEKLGLESADDLQALVEDARKRRESETSDLDKFKAEAEAEREARKKAEKELLATKRERTIEREVRKAGVPDKVVDKVTRLLDLDELDGDADIDDVRDAVKAAIADLKKDVPALFGESDSGDDGDDDDIDPRTGFRRQKPSGTNQPPTDSRPPQPPRRTNTGKSTEEQATDLLHSRHPRLADSKS
jgi:hypothetical protein